MNSDYLQIIILCKFLPVPSGAVGRNLVAFPEGCRNATLLMAGYDGLGKMGEKLYPGELYMRPPFFLFVLSKRKNAPRGCKKEKPLGGRKPISPPGPPACPRFSNVTGELPGGGPDGLRDRVAACAGLRKT